MIHSLSFSTGVLHWVENMKWKKLSDWKKSERAPLVVNGIIEGYQKRTGNFALYWINQAGHMVYIYYFCVFFNS